MKKLTKKRERKIRKDMAKFLSQGLTGKNADLIPKAVDDAVKTMKKYLKSKKIKRT